MPAEGAAILKKVEAELEQFTHLGADYPGVDQVQAMLQQVSSLRSELSAQASDQEPGPSDQAEPAEEETAPRGDSFRLARMNASRDGVMSRGKESKAKEDGTDSEEEKKRPKKSKASY